MRCIEYVTAVAILLSRFVSETLGKNCSKGVSWKDKTFYRRLRLQGEWITFNCAIETSENATLRFGKKEHETKYKVEDKKMKLVSKNVFNISNLITDDGGWYTCIVCGKTHAKFLEVVSGRGKAYAKPIVEKKPNKTSYEIGGNVTLSCHVEGTTIPLYDIQWHKLLPNGTSKPLKSEESVVKSSWPLTELSGQNEGTYKCTIFRSVLRYSASALVNINVKEPIKPEIHMVNKDNFQVVQGKDFSLPYKVTSYPANSDIQWWRSKDGEKYELIAECSPKSEKCEKHSGKENISNTSLEIKDLKFPHDEYFYKINASNKHGNDSKTFELNVYVKPVIALEKIHVFKKGNIINCTLDKGVSWKDKTFYRRLRIQGEWITFNCAIKTSENATLWFGKTENEMKYKVDDKKMKLVSKNVFNISNLTTEDGGWYTCEVCGKRRAKFLEVSGQGKAYAKPIVEKKPNKTSYEIGGRVTLSCHVEGTTLPVYDIKWHKLLPNGTLGKPRKSEESVVKSILMLNELSGRDEGTYKCTIFRSILRYSASALVNINVKEPIKPEIYMVNKDNFQVVQGKNFSLPYKVTSYPASDIQWWRSKDGEKYELIAECSRKSEKCKKHSGKESISNTTLEIKDLKFPHDEYFYKINASNKHGNDSKTFELKVYVKPVIALETTHVFKKGKIINCTLDKGDINPRQVNYTWYSCGTSKCSEKNSKLVASYALHLPKSQSAPKMYYRCEAANAAGSDYHDIEVLQQHPNTKNSQKANLLSIIVPIALISIIILVAASFVLYRRKKLYGGFYLFSYPPLPDYMAILDKNGNIQDQLQKLPFIPEWEFPRERIMLVSELGSGQFGMVWLADAIGISAFRPRDALRERAGGRRLSSLFDRTAKRNSYIYCKEITQVAVKTVKDNYGRNDIADLKSELKILIHVGENENIVNILGACTKGKSSDLYIIMEYCPHGNLREFLKNSRDRYRVEENRFITDLSQEFGPKNLIHFGLQIAKGMKFLISRKVIHRDLAARNILIGQAYVAKVGDFGLARDVYKYQEYVRTSTGMVPFKWMALESIKDAVSTEKSDVWSFGVLLWELFTLGGTPYPAMSVSEVNEFLQKGKRMDPPVHCPQEIYHVMSTCWAENPEERPDFSTLNETFSKILGFKPVTQESDVFNEIKKGCPNENNELDYIQPNVDSEKEKFICVA